MNIKNKLAPYTIKYHCESDCEMGGCPGHEALFEYESTSESFHIKWAFNEIWLNSQQFDDLINFYAKLTEEDK